MNMNLLAAITPPYIYHGCSTQKTSWEEKFTLGEFTYMNMGNYCRCNVRKHIDIKDSEICITLKISLKLGSLDKTRITSSEQRENLAGPGKGLITYMGIKTNVRPKKKKARHTITNVSMKDISKIINDF